MRHRVIGSAARIITDARALGILCRPTHEHGPYMLGSAYDVSGSAFILWEPGNKRHLLCPSPEQMTMPWELTTEALVTAELRYEQETPW